MKKINKPGDNLGGLLKLWAVPLSAYYFDASGIQIISSLNIYELYCSPESMEFSEIQELTPAGRHFNTVINGFIPQDNTTIQEAIAYMETQKWVVIFIDGNEKYKLAGNQTDPLRLSSELNTGKDTASLAGYSIQFSGITKTRAMFINNPF